MMMQDMMDDHVGVLWAFAFHFFGLYLFEGFKHHYYLIGRLFGDPFNFWVTSGSFVKFEYFWEGETFRENSETFFDLIFFGWVILLVMFIFCLMMCCLAMSGVVGRRWRCHKVLIGILVFAVTYFGVVYAAIGSLLFLEVADGGGVVVSFGEEWIMADCGGGQYWVSADDPRFYGRRGEGGEGIGWFNNSFSCPVRGGGADVRLDRIYTYDFERWKGGVEGVRGGGEFKWMYQNELIFLFFVLFEATCLFQAVIMCRCGRIIK